jgi:hypothetical protein
MFKGKASKAAVRTLDRRRSLAGIPVVNPGVAVEDLEAGRCVLVVRQRLKRDGLLRRFKPTERQRRVKLDELGCFVFKRIDGERPVIEIVDAFVARFKVNRREAELSVVDFLKSLTRRNIISIAVS